MSDERYTPEVGTWLKGREAAPSDPQEAARRVATRLPHVRQRSRWWPFPVLYRRAKTPTTSDTTESRPSPIPAINGHAPTVIGRTHTMFSPVKAITAGALVFAIGGVMLIAQPFDQGPSVPGASSDDAPVEFASIESSEVLSEGDFDASGNEIIRMAREVSDPRLSGTWTEVWDCRGAPVEACVAGVGVENEGGTWLGRAEWFGGPPVGAFGWTVLEGQGDYAGLTAFLHKMFHPEDGESDVLAVYEGELPTYPEPPAE